MNIRTLIRVWFVALTAAGMISSLQAESIVYKATSGGKMTIKGTSTVHDWEVSSGIIGGTMEISSDFPLGEVDGTPAISPNQKVKVAIPVRSLKSGKKRMDEVMHKAMKHPKETKIAYELTKISVSKDPRKEGEPVKYDTEGKLTVSGVTKPVKFPVTIQTSDGSTLMVTGATTVKMTDHGIDPPAPKVALGLIKTGDELDLSWKWFLKRTVKK